MRPRRAIAIALTSAAALLAACTGGDAQPSPTPQADSPSAVSPTATAPSFRLVVDLRDVRGEGVASGVRPRDLRRPAHAIRRTMTDLYRIGFVDPAQWHGGTFPALFPLFAGKARAHVRRDLQELTVGREAGSLDAVRPSPARLGVRFLVGERRHPVVAVAHVRFAGVGLEGARRRRIRQDASYTLRKLRGAWRIVAYDVRSRSIAGPGRAAFAPGLPRSRPTFYLVIGSDARPGQPVGRTRADSLHIVGVNPRRERASVLGIPRDSWVPIPGWGTDKINASLVAGGPELVVQTVERLTRIRIDGYVLTGFKGFERAVAEIGGIDITIPFPISDRYAHVHLGAGPTHLSPAEALGFSRARHALATGDFGRSLNQGRVLIAALSTLRRAVEREGDAALFPWAIAAARELHTDLSLGDLVDLLLAAPAFQPSRIRNEVASGHVGSVGGRSVVFLNGSAYGQFRDLGRDGLLGGR